MVTRRQDMATKPEGMSTWTCRPADMTLGKLAMPKSKEIITSSESDSDGPPSPKKKKSEKKKAQPSTGTDGELRIQLSKMRFVSVSEFRGKKLVNIREYYEKDGDMLPGRKGISLSVDQWNKLKDAMDDIDAAL